MGLGEFNGLQMYGRTHREGDQHELRGRLKGPICGSVHHGKHKRSQPQHVENCER